MSLSPSLEAGLPLTALRTPVCLLSSGGGRCLFFDEPSWAPCARSGRPEVRLTVQRRLPRLPAKNAVVQSTCVPESGQTGVPSQLCLHCKSVSISKSYHCLKKRSLLFPHGLL